MYQVMSVVLKQGHPLQHVFGLYTGLAKLMKNACIYRMRQLSFALLKDYDPEKLGPAQLEVLDEFAKAGVAVGKKHAFPGYLEFVRMFTGTHNPDYYNALPSQCSQQIIKEALADFKGYFAAMKVYKKDPSKFTGKPKLPGYCKNKHISFDITNQEAVIYRKPDGSYECKIPKTKHRVQLGRSIPGRLKEVTVQPYYDTYKLCFVFEAADTPPGHLDPSRILGLDPGVDNLLTAGNNCGLTPFIANGKAIKSMNRYTNMRVANLKAMLPENGTSKQVQHIWKKRKQYMQDQAHKISRYIVDYCVANNIGTIVIGKNDGWKESMDDKCHNDQQNFRYIPYDLFFQKIREKGEAAGVCVIIREESYTSRSSFLDLDYLATYGVDDSLKQCSGKRVRRGLYRSGSGVYINADVNGACNIIRKEFPDAFAGITDFSYLTRTVDRIMFM